MEFFDHALAAIAIVSLTSGAPGYPMTAIQLRVRKKIIRAGQFWTAAWRGFLYQRKFKTPLHVSLRTLWNALKPADEVSWGQYRSRLSQCNRCPLYDTKRRVCGHDSPDPESWITKLLKLRGLPFGCRCWLPMKTKRVLENCFLEEVGINDGWQEDF